MAITSSAKKALRASKRKRVFNLRHKSEIEKNVKQFKKLISENKKAAAEKILPSLYKSIDKAAKTKFMKKNTASRMKSRLTLALNKIAK